jgi:hypothetical protein
VDDPKFERRAADYVRSVKCPACGQMVELPREEPWLLAGGEDDISRILVRSAPRLARPLRGKIHLIVGADDTFYLDKPVRLLQRRIDSLGYEARFTYIPGRGHFDLYDGHLLRRIAGQMYRVARQDSSWKPRPADRSTELAN